MNVDITDNELEELSLINDKLSKIIDDHKNPDLTHLVMMDMLCYSIFRCGISKEEFLDETGSAWDEYHKEVCAISEIHDQSSSNFRLIHSINEPVYHTQQYSKIAQSIFGAINNHSPKLVVNALVKMMCCNFAFSGFKKGWFMRELEDGYDRAALKLQPKSGASFED